MPDLIDRDFKNTRLSNRPLMRPRKRRWHLFLAAGVLSGAVAATLGTNTQSETEAKPLRAVPVAFKNEIEPAPIRTPLSRELALPRNPADLRAPANTPEPTPDQAVPARTHEVTVTSGDSLSAIFDQVKIPQRDLVSLIADRDIEKTLRRIRPGDRLSMSVDPDGRLLRLVYADSPHSRRIFTKVAGAFESRREQDPIETRLQLAHGTIEDSLFLAATEAGLTDSMTMELATLFGWDIDFALDVRSGDRFSVIYESRYKFGELIGHGSIVAAEFVNQGKSFRAIRFRDPEGRTDYFDPDGNSVRKAFLRTPVDFARISSRFSTARKHPVLNRMRAHRGVDYAAPSGTKVRSTGDGKIDFIGRKGGYGKVIIVKHTSSYSTLYAHLSRFERGMRAGRRVKQGQVIGRVGQTGLATGPHLHYEFRVGGVQRNPLTIKLPGATPVREEFRDEFNAHAAPLLANLDTLGRSLLAAGSTPNLRID